MFVIHFLFFRQTVKTINNKAKVAEQFYYMFSLGNHETCPKNMVLEMTAKLPTHRQNFVELYELEQPTWLAKHNLFSYPTYINQQIDKVYCALFYLIVNPSAEDGRLQLIEKGAEEKIKWIYQQKKTKINLNVD